MGVTYDKNQDNVVLAREFYSDAEAHIAEAALNQEGIMCVIDNELFSRIYPIGNSSLGGLRLMVRRRDLDKAIQIIDSLNFEGN